MFKDGKKVFEINGVYTAPSFDFREKLTSMLESAVGYSYPDFNDKGTAIQNDNHEEAEIIHAESHIYKLFVASPAEEPLVLVTDLLNTLLTKDINENKHTIFTYIKEFRGEEFSQQQLESLEEIGTIVENLGGKCIKSNSIEMLAGTLNTITNFT